MTIMVKLPSSVETSLRKEARKQRVSPETLAAHLLEDALAAETFPTPEEVVAKIQSLPSEPLDLQPAMKALQEILETDPEGVDFDLEAWTQEWEKVEEEMKAVTRANSAAEGLDPLNE